MLQLDALPDKPIQQSLKLDELPDKPSVDLSSLPDQPSVGQPTVNKAPEEDSLRKLLTEDRKQAIIPSSPTPAEVLSTSLIDKSPIGTGIKIATGKPILSPGEMEAINKQPIPKTVGDILGGISTAALIAAIPGVGLPVAFGSASALQTAANQADRVNDPNFQPNAAQLAEQQAIGGAQGAVMGKIFDTPATGQISPAVAKAMGIKLPSNVATRALEQATGAGAAGLTGDISSQAVEGKNPDIKQSLINAGMNTAIYGLTTAAIKFPELRDTVTAEGSRLSGKPLEFEEARKVVAKAGIDPEVLSPEFVSAAYNAKRADFIKNTLEAKMKQYGMPEETVQEVLKAQDVRQREGILTKYAASLAESNPEQFAKIAPYFDQIKNGADPVDVMMMADLHEKILAPLQSKIEQTITTPQKPLQNTPEVPLNASTENVAPIGEATPVQENLAPVKAIIPPFRSTEEAIRFGQENKHKPEVLAELKRLREESTAKHAEMFKKPDLSDDDLQEGMNEAVRGQFYREALESSQGTINNKSLQYALKKETPVEQPQKDLESIVNHVKPLGLSKEGFVKYARIKKLNIAPHDPEIFYDTFVKPSNKQEIGWDDVVPDDAMKILNNRFATFSGISIPKELTKKGITLKNLIKGFEQIGGGEEIIKESTIALKKAGYKKIGNIHLTEEGSKPEIKNKLSSESGQIRLPIETVAKATKEIVNLVSPTTMVPKPSLDTAMKMKGERDKAEFQLEQQTKSLEDAFDKMPKEGQVGFIDNIKNGVKQSTPELQKVADMMRQIEDNYWSEVKHYKPSMAYKDNHYRVLWKVIPGQPKVSGFKGMFRRPLQGSKGYMKKSTLKDMSEGLEKGGVPYSYNPMTMWRNSIMDMQKFITAQRMWKKMKDMGYVKFVKEHGKVPDGFVKLNDSIARVYFPAEISYSEGAEPIKVAHQTGEYYVEENTGRILNNFLSKDWIRDSAIGGSLLKFKNITTAIELSLSTFHASYVSLAAMASDVGLGLQKVINLGMVQGNGPAFIDGLTNLIQGSTGISPAKFTKTGADMIKYVGKEGFKNSRAGQDFIKHFPDAEALLDDLFIGGGKLAIHQDYKINSLKAFKEGINNKEPWAVAISSLPAANEMIMKPLFEIYIPRLKIGAFLHEMSHELVSRETSLKNGSLTRAELARQVWSSIENRFGEMNFDNLFWNRTFKSALQLLFRSVTWKVGALKNITHGFADQVFEIKNAIDERRVPLLNRNTAYLFGIALLITAFSQIIMRLFLKESPKDLKDIVAPRYDKEGNRISLNTHMKDWIHLTHSPLRFVTNSLSGQIGREIDIWNNKDFYNTEIYDKQSPFWKQEIDKLQHRFPTPFSISNQQKLKGDEAPKVLKGLVLAGFAQPSPGYISQTAAEEKAHEINGEKPHATLTKEQKAHSDFKRELMLKIENKDDHSEIKKVLKEGKINPKEYAEIISNSKKTPLERSVNHMTYEEVAQVMEKANPDELMQLKPIFRKKVNNKLLSADKFSYGQIKEFKKFINDKFGE